MGEYRIVLPKTSPSGFSADPDQSVNNAGSPILDQPLTIQNGAMIVLAVSQGKKLAGVAYSAVVDQIGDGRLEVATVIGQKVGTYVAIGLATGVVGVGLYASAEILTTGLRVYLESHSIALDNEMKVMERGARRNFGVGYYD